MVPPCDWTRCGRGKLSLCALFRQHTMEHEPQSLPRIGRLAGCACLPGSGPSSRSNGLLVFLSFLSPDLFGRSVGLWYRPIPDSSESSTESLSPKVGIWRFDPRFGFSHLPGAQGIDEQKAFRVTYTIDDEGCRVTPNPEKPAGRITCLGCSFTFGTGVEDDQCYPYFLATRHWTDYKVRNRAVTAYGTSHAYLGLIEELLDEEPPTLVLYGWIHLHKHRNYIRRNWVAHLANPWSPFEKPFKVNDYRKHPHFEIEDDRLVFKGVIGIDEIPEDQPDVRQEEAALSKRLLVEMVRLSREKNVPFVVVILPVMESMSEVLPEYLTEALAETDALWIDAREANRGFVKGDWHPNPETHAAIADLIADSTVVREILDNKPFPPAPLRKRPHPLAPSP